MTEIIIVSEGQFCRQLEVAAGETKDMVLLVYPGVSCDIKLDVRLVGEGAEANIYGAYVCGADERVKIAVDMHHEVPDAHPGLSDSRLLELAESQQQVAWSEKQAEAEQ